MTKSTTRKDKGVLKRPLHPKIVIAAALFLPGSGQMLNGDPIRGITMQFFMMFLAYITYKVTGPEISLLGRIAGGVFVYLVSVLDARAVAIRRAKAWERITGARTEDVRDDGEPNGSPKTA